MSEDLRALTICCLTLITIIFLCFRGCQGIEKQRIKMGLSYCINEMGSTGWRPEEKCK